MTTHPAPSYGAVARFNHWLVAIAMIAMLGFGLFLENVELERSLRGTLMGLHKATGVLVLLYGIWRVGWRLYQGFPPAVGTMPPWQEKAAKAAHWVLLAGILLMPLSGLFGSIFGGRAVDVFGLFTVPALPESEGLKELMYQIHSLCAYVILAVLAIHIAGALKHHCLDRDATLTRMLTGKTT